MLNLSGQRLSGFAVSLGQRREDLNPSIRFNSGKGNRSYNIESTLEKLTGFEEVDLRLLSSSGSGNRLQAERLIHHAATDPELASGIDHNPPLVFRDANLLGGAGVGISRCPSVPKPNPLALLMPAAADPLA